MLNRTTIVRVVAPLAAIFGALGLFASGPSTAHAAPIVSYVFTAGVDAFGTNGAGYSQAVLLAPCEVRFAYDTRMTSQVGVNGTRVYSPGANQVFLQVRIGNDTYRAGPLSAVGSIAIARNASTNTDTLTTSLSPTQSGQPNLQFIVTYPSVAGQALPMTLPSSSFQFDISTSTLRLFRTTAQDFYFFQLGDIRPALSPFCPPDFNLSGDLTVQDIFDFLNAWFANNALTDFNSANGITVQDIFDFLNAWFAGCP